MTSSIMGRSTGFTSGQRLNPVQRALRVWDYRRILGLMIGRDLRVRYANSLLGYVWSVLDPLMMAAVYWFLFTQIITRKVGYPPYILFLVSGQLAWQWINGSINQSVGALRSEAQMVRSSSVPRELWILRTILSKGVEYLLSLPVLAIFAIGYSRQPNRYIFLLPLAMVLTVLLCMGLGMILAPLSVLIRDIRSIVRIILRMLFFLSPILYSLHDVSQKRAGAAAYVGWNPVSGIMSCFRAMFFPQELDWVIIEHAIIVSVVIFVIGIWTFNRLERPMLKEI
jgi:ABC-2 type transport system permease protein